MERTRHSLRSLVVALLTFSALHAATTVRAQSDRVLLIDPGDELERAVRAALEPWQLAIIVSSAPSPGSSAPLSHRRASALAASEQVGSVVWISTHEAGYALWVYDAASQHVFVRPLASAPPYQGPAAAAVALSLKTLLRHGESAPRVERFGASPAAPEQTAKATPSAAATRAQDGSSLAAIRQPRGASRVEPDATLLARFGFVEARSIEPRVGLGATFWPRGGMFGLGLRAAFGPDYALRTPLFQGTLSAISAGAAARIRWEPRPWLRVGAGIAAQCDFTRLYNVQLGTGQRAPGTWRYVPSVAAELEFAWLALPWLRIGLRGGPSWAVRTQQYLARGTELLELSRVALEAGLLLGFGDHDP